MVIYDEISESKNQILNHNIYDSQFSEPIKKNVTDDLLEIQKAKSITLAVLACESIQFCRSL